MIRTCKICGKEFKTPPRVVRMGWGLYCSRRCSGVSRQSSKSLGIYDGFRVYIQAQGYASIVLGRSNEKLLHVYIMEKHLGRKLVGEHVHHRDGNKLNNSLDNLMIVDKRFHAQEHARIRIRALGGDPELHKFCGHCKTMKLRSEFHKSRGTYDGLFMWCKECNCAYVRRANARKKAQRDMGRS